MSNQDTSKTSPKPVKPCPRCGSAAGKGNGGSQCQCKKGKNAGKNSAIAGKPEPCDAPIGKAPTDVAGTVAGTATKGGCGCK